MFADIPTTSRQKEMNTQQQSEVAEEINMEKKTRVLLTRANFIGDF